MARRKNVKRIDPRYFLDETVNRNDDGSALEECGEMDGEAIDISAPGTEVHVDDISQLSPEEAFAAGMAAARDAIDQVMGGPDGPPPDGGFSGNGPFGEPVMQETEQTRLDESKQHRKGLVRLQELAKIRNEADVVKGPWKPSKPGFWKKLGLPISSQRGAENAAAKKAAKKAAGPGLKVVRPVVDPARRGMFQATKQAGKQQARRMAAARGVGAALGPAATAAGVGITAYQGTRAAMDAALPADSGLRKSSGEIYDYTDLGLAFGAPYKGTKEGDPADSLKTNPNKPYNPYLDPENTGTDSAGRVWVEPELKEAEFQDTGYPEEDIEVNRAAVAIDSEEETLSLGSKEGRLAILASVGKLLAAEVGDWILPSEDDPSFNAISVHQSPQGFLDDLKEFSLTYAVNEDGWNKIVQQLQLEI